jgi:hypothetical protein
MEITIQQMKKSLLLLNKLHRQKFRSYLVKTPSKLSPDELKKFFTLLFMKKEDHYIPKKTTRQLVIDESEFKKIFVKPTKTPKPRTPKPVMTKPKKETASKRTIKKEEIKENDKQSIIKEEVKEVVKMLITKEEIEFPIKKQEVKEVKKVVKSIMDKVVEKIEDINKLNDEVNQLFETYYRLANIIMITDNNNDMIDMTVDKINMILTKLKEYNVDCDGLTCINNLKKSTKLNKLTNYERYKYLSKIFKDEKYFMKKNIS